MSDLVDKALAGDRRSLSRILTEVEAQTDEGRAALRRLYPRAGRAHVIGVTGAAGCGKSTLVAALAKEFRRRNRTVGIVAVDPSSPFTQGAILGDRIRMQDLIADPQVFIRSMATRGSLGGLAATTYDLVAVLDAVGKEVVLIETVGAGQDEVAVAAAAQTTILVNTPGTGDDIQALKAGIMEVADVLVVNKADMSGTERLVGYLASLLSLSPPNPWKPPIIRTVALKDKGITELADALESHYRHLAETTRLEEHRRSLARSQLLSAAREELLGRLLAATAPEGRLEEIVEGIARREVDPYTAALALIDFTEKAGLRAKAL